VRIDKSRIVRLLLEFLDFRRFSEWHHAIARVRSDFRHYHGASPHLLRPQTFSEKVQWRKLFDLNPQFGVFSDKLRVRDFIRELAGPGVLPPLLWAGDDPDAVPLETLMPPYVLKSTHASGQTMIVTDAAALDVAQARATMKSWLAVCYASHSEEPAYALVPRRIMVEACLLDCNGKRPRELLFFVFAGQVHYIMLIYVEGDERRSGGFYDRHWQRLDWFLSKRPPDSPMPRPPRFDEMVALAERLAAGIDHVRVDFYDCGDRFYVGELTLYSWGGNSPFHRPEMDAALGKPWRIRHPMLRALLTVLTRRRRVDPASARSTTQQAQDQSLAIQATERGGTLRNRGPVSTL
jgi:hypothetical protein